MSVPLPARAITFLRLSFLRGAVGWGVAGTTSSFPDGVVSVDIGRAPFSNVTFVPVSYEPREVRRDYPSAPLQWCNVSAAPPWLLARPATEQAVSLRRRLSAGFPGLSVPRA